jgi:hypothetical protein
MKIGENWKCPYCGHAQVISKERHYTCLERFYYIHDWVEGLPGYSFEAIVCANADCKKLSLTLSVVRRGEDIPPNRFQVLSIFQSWRLLPSSFAKPQPDYIPEALRKDYEEACAIRDLSPKASATITRRCIQGIIRDFCGIAKGRLIDEIKELRKRVNAGQAPAGVQPDTVDAIDHIRSIGNIGAHMEADINVIVDVDPGEAQVLIELTEMLFDEWYVAREQRTQRLAQLSAIAASKAQQKQLPPPRPATAITAQTSPGSSPCI